MYLKPNLNWKKNKGITLPTVLANVTKSQGYLQVDFYVDEPLKCFRAQVLEDGGKCWEDSCVEIFMQHPLQKDTYFNFEVTSRGYMLAAMGKSREGRTLLAPEITEKIIRTKQLANIVGDMISWAMTVRIPCGIFGISSFDGIDIYGNLYKCGDCTETPHYLSAFPIDTEKPDFHRPEFFDILESNC